MPKNKKIKPDWPGILMGYYRTGRIPQCPICGEEKMQIEKYYPSDRRVSTWFICPDCNAWSGFFDGIHSETMNANDR